MSGDLSSDPLCCLNCGSKHTWRDEVDIGVGIQYGPLHCDDCGWTEEAEPSALDYIADCGDQFHV